MTVRELMDLLAAHPPGLRVVVNGYEQNFDDVTPERVSLTRIERHLGQPARDVSFARLEAAARRRASQENGRDYSEQVGALPASADREKPQ